MFFGASAPATAAFAAKTKAFTGSSFTAKFCKNCPIKQKIPGYINGCSGNWLTTK
jgi:hypothetical protein